MSYLLDTCVISEFIVAQPSEKAAFHHHLVVVTRDQDDFAPSGARLFNPWE